MVATVLATLAGAYLVGSIPTGYLAGRARGIDLRAVGSGNIGATNALRILGKPIGILVLVIDALKGLAGCTLVPHAAARWLDSSSPTAPGLPVWLPVLGGLAAVLGHNYTCWLRFKGGKGVATSAGVLAGLMPLPFLCVLAVFLAAMAVTRIVSLSSLLAALALPPAAWFWHRDLVLESLSLALAALAFFRHRANIARLLAGTEPRLGQRHAPSAPAAPPAPPASPSSSPSPSPSPPPSP